MFLKGLTEQVLIKELPGFQDSECLSPFPGVCQVRGNNFQFVNLILFPEVKAKQFNGHAGKQGLDVGNVCLCQTCDFRPGLRNLNRWI